MGSSTPADSMRDTARWYERLAAEAMYRDHPGVRVAALTLAESLHAAAIGMEVLTAEMKRAGEKMARKLSESKWAAEEGRKRRRLDDSH